MFRIFVLILSCISCASEGKSKKQNSQIPEEVIIAKVEADTIKDSDPYFVESESATSFLGPRSISRNCLQDSKGNIWIASWQGIIEFDGANYINHTLKDSLRKFHVFSVHEDRHGILWFGTIGAGLYRYDGDLFTNITTEDGLGSDSIQEIYEDSSGALWFCTSGGLTKYSNGTYLNYDEKDGLVDTDINSIVELEEGRFWIGTRGNAFELTKDGSFILLEKPGSSTGFLNVRCLIKSSSGQIYFGGNDGLWAFDGNTFYQIHRPFTGYIYETDAKQLYISAVDEVTGMWNVLRFGPHKKKASVTMEQVVPPLFSMGNMYFGICALSDGSMLFGNLKGIIKLKAEKLEIL